jgi:hypothetical protein
MRAWISVLALLLLFTGCSQQKSQKSEKIAFSVLIPKPADGQRVNFVEGMGIFTSTLPHSRVSAMVINNPIQADKEAVIAVAVENLGKNDVPMEWNKITFFHPKDIIKLLPINKTPDYFNQPERCKPLLGREIYKKQLLKYGVIAEGNTTTADALLPTEKVLAKVFSDIRKDICYAKIPENSTLHPGEVKVGYLVIEMPREHFIKNTLFMLKIPVADDVHKLRFALQPLE